MYCRLSNLKKIDAITRGSIRDFLLSKYAGGLSQSRVMLFKDVISGVLGYAVDEELVDTNPTAKITKKLFPKGRKRPVNESEVFSENELETYLATCEEHFPKYYLFFLTACLTGLRLGELLALEWGSINLKNRYISIKQSYRRGRFTRPKNGKIRRVDMSDQLHEKLKNKLKQEFKDVSELVFQKDGRVIEQSWMNWIHKQILKKAELRHVKLHGFRHTFASHLLSKGVDAYYVSQQLGHSGISITCDVYGLFIRSEENRHVNLLDFGQKVATNLHPEGDQKIQPIEITSSI